MGVKTGKRWYRVKPPKRSVCVESRPWCDRDHIRKIADWCYKAIYSNPWMRARECRNMCEPGAYMYPPETFEEKLKRLGFPSKKRDALSFHSEVKGKFDGR
jgi:hypothetical protein